METQIFTKCINKSLKNDINKYNITLTWIRKSFTWSKIMSIKFICITCMSHFKWHVNKKYKNHCIHKIDIYCNSKVSTPIYMILVSFKWSRKNTRTIVGVIIWLLDLQLPMQSVPITTNIVSSNPAQTRCTRYNIMW